MWTCMPRLTAAKRRHLSESLWGDADVSYYHCRWNFAPFQSMPFGFRVAQSILHLHLTCTSPVGRTCIDSLLIVWPFLPFNCTLSYSRLHISVAGRKWGYHAHFIHKLYKHNYHIVNSKTRVGLEIWLCVQPSTVCLSHVLSLSRFFSHVNDLGRVWQCFSP